ncbi:MAG TPA: tetratricopeptide repeat protein [Planctomycetota bacterium]|nr:tetratricopeptide repeat protein [Planctomycetota bacterium]
MRSACVKAGCALLVAALAVGCESFGTKSPQTVDAYAQAQSRIASGDTAGAAKLLEQHVAASPTSEYVTDAWLLLGDCRLRLKDYPGAQLAYENAQKNARTPAIDARARAGLGAAMMHQKRWAEAARAYESALAVSEQDVAAPSVMLYMGQAYMRSGNWILGRDRLRKLVSKYPGSVEAPAARDMLAEPSDTFSVQMGAYATHQDADKMLKMLEEKQLYGARIMHQPWADSPFTVRVGNYVSYDTAVREAEKLKSIEPGCFVVP